MALKKEFIMLIIGKIGSYSLLLGRCGKGDGEVKT